MFWPALNDIPILLQVCHAKLENIPEKLVACIALLKFYNAAIFNLSKEKCTMKMNTFWRTR